MKPSILSIAGFDPSGGAGLQADLKVFQSYNLHGLSVVSAITAQNSQGVRQVSGVSIDIFEGQLMTLLEDIRPDAVKIGMLYSVDIVRCLAGIIKEYGLKNIVIDPVFISSSGKRLALDGAADAIADELFPKASIVIPNIEEAEYFIGGKITTISDMKEAAVKMSKRGMSCVIITGGHLKDEAVDVFYDRNQFHQISSIKYDGEFHGTGCTFSSAVAANLGLGKTQIEAFISAKEFIENAIKTSYKIGKGMKFLNISSRALPLKIPQRDLSL
ncbi:MAG: bifunctional hydroxymethylpyrimidine kinase/phosphomethylpyrimidine kinase [Nitrospirae bacterium]|nr:bifunctional hydroxymethylpyrimidine kinase/phosphomethylpyrimidine kinase [Nitrospirota bacterium]MBF0542437.1 bifunctional hydroxymethylpyrimidine kinase/phosphomethylpyrimidine kinase [Nitrospirota bacterium]